MASRGTAEHLNARHLWALDHRDRSARRARKAIQSGEGAAKDRKPSTMQQLCPLGRGPLVDWLRGGGPQQR